jgi:hypothetical protein
MIMVVLKMRLHYKVNELFFVKDGLIASTRQLALEKVLCV